MPKNDNVNSPSHYQIKIGDKRMEVIQLLRYELGIYGFINFCKGNVKKYILRHNKKNGLEDLQKAVKYIECIIQAMQDTEFNTFTKIKVDIDTIENNLNFFSYDLFCNKLFKEKLELSKAYRLVQANQYHRALTILENIIYKMELVD